MAWLGHLVKAFLGLAVLAAVVALSAVLGIHIHSRITEENPLPRTREVLNLGEQASIERRATEQSSPQEIAEAMVGASRGEALRPR